jgi:hypothetical protein
MAVDKRIHVLARFAELAMSIPLNMYESDLVDLAALNPGMESNPGIESWNGIAAKLHEVRGPVMIAGSVECDKKRLETPGCTSSRGRSGNFAVQAFIIVSFVQVLRACRSCMRIILYADLAFSPS